MESVVIARWPHDAARRGEFARRRVPCLWLIERGAESPIVEPWEDWIRLPATDREVEARLRILTDRACRPELVERALLRNTFGSVALPESEAAIIELFLESHGRPVPRTTLERAVWADGPPSPRALDDLVYRLRRHIKPLRLNVFSARERGFVIGVDLEMSPAQASSGEASDE